MTASGGTNPDDARPGDDRWIAASVSSSRSDGRSCPPPCVLRGGHFGVRIARWARRQPPMWKWKAAGAPRKTVATAVVRPSLRPSPIQLPKIRDYVDFTTSASSETANGASEKWPSEHCPEIKSLSRAARKRRRRKQRLIQQRLEESWGAASGKPRPLGSADAFEKATKKEEQDNPPPRGWPSARGGCKRPSRDADKAVDPGRQQASNEDCNQGDPEDWIAPAGAEKTTPMPATKLCASYADLRNYKIPKIRRSEKGCEALNMAEEQNNRSPQKLSPAQQCQKSRTDTPEKSSATSRLQKLISPPRSLGDKTSGKDLVDQIMDEMDKSYPKVTSARPKNTFPAPSRHESGTAEPAYCKSPAKRPLEQDCGFGNSNGVVNATVPPPEKRPSFGGPFPRRWEEPRELCIVCRRRSVSDCGLRDTCIRCSFSQEFRGEQSRDEGIARDKPAAAVSQPPPRRLPELPPAKPISRRDSSDVENRKERIVRSRQDSGVSKVDGSGTEMTGSSSPVKKHGCGRKKRAVRKVCRSKAVISSSDESSDTERDSRGAAPGSWGEKKTDVAASSPRQDGRARPADDSREPHLLREKNENSDGSSTLVPTTSKDKKPGSSLTVKKKKQKGTDEGYTKRKNQRSAWRKAKDMEDYLKALDESETRSQPLKQESISHEEAKREKAEDEEGESIEAVLACLRQAEREGLAKAASNEEATRSIAVPEAHKVVSDIPGIVANHLGQPSSPTLIVSSCRSLSMDDWEKMETEPNKPKGTVALHDEASVDVGMLGPDVVMLSSDGGSSDVESPAERLSCDVVRADLSPIEIEDSSSDSCGVKNNGIKRMGLGDSSSDSTEVKNKGIVLMGLSYEVSYDEDGVPCVRVRDIPGSLEETQSSLEQDVAAVTRRKSVKILTDTGGMVTDEPLGFVGSVDTASLKGEAAAKDTLHGQSAITSLVSASSMEEGTARKALHSDSAVASPRSSALVTAVLPSKGVPVAISFSHPTKEPPPLGDQASTSLGNALNPSVTIEEEEEGSATLSFEGRPSLVQQQTPLATNADISSHNDSSSAEWDPISVVDELFLHRTGVGSPESRCRMDSLHGFVSEYMAHLERFFATFGASKPAVRAALVDGLLEDGGFTKLWHVVKKLWHFQATSKCISRGRVMALEDAVCAVLADSIERLGPAFTERDLPPYMSFEALPPEVLRGQQSAGPLQMETGPSQNQVAEVDLGVGNSTDTLEARLGAVAPPDVTGRPDTGQTPAAMAVMVPTLEDRAAACQTVRSPVEDGVSDTRLSGVVVGVVPAVPTEARTPVMEAALPAASPSGLQRVATTLTAQVKEPCKSPPSVQASTWHPPASRQVAQAKDLGVCHIEAPEADCNPAAARETSSWGIDGGASSKALPTPASNAFSACKKVLLQARNTKHIPSAHIPPHNPLPLPPPLQQGQLASGAMRSASGAVVRFELRDPPPLQRAPFRLPPNPSFMTQQQLQELQCQLAAYSYVTSLLSARVQADSQQASLAALPLSSPQQPQPLNLSQQPGTASALKRMPPLQYVPLRAQPSVAGSLPREVSNQQLPQKPQSSQEHRAPGPGMLPPSSANRSSAGTEEPSRGPAASQELSARKPTALTRARAELQLQLERRRYLELLLRYKLGIEGQVPGEGQQVQRASQNLQVASARPTERRASEAQHENLDPSLQQQLQQNRNPEQSSSRLSFTRDTRPNGGALNGGVEQNDRTVASMQAENNSSQYSPKLVRPWCNQRQQQQYKQQQKAVGTASSAGTPSFAESNRDHHYTSSTLEPMLESPEQQSQARNQPAVIHSLPEQDAAAKDGLQGRNVAPHVVAPSEHAAYQRLAEARYRGVLFDLAGSHVWSTPGVLRSLSEALAAPRGASQTPHRAEDALPSETLSRNQTRVAKSVSGSEVAAERHHQ